MRMTKKQQLKRRHMRIRHKVNGTSDCPRMCVRKSLRHVYVQLFDDSSETGCVTLATYGTANKENAGKHFRNIASATELGKSIGEDLKKRGIETIVFDRGGYRYHGLVKALADAVRESGIRF